MLAIAPVPPKELELEVAVAVVRVLIANVVLKLWSIDY